MEALTAAAVAGLTVYDMCKALRCQGHRVERRSVGVEERGGELGGLRPRGGWGRVVVSEGVRTVL
eukprot:29067-Pelagococcus_subviridis.AAC.3